MSLKRNVNEMVTKTLPEKGNRRNQAIDHTGLHKRPQIEQIVNYLANGQEHTRFPDREAKFIRNHPFMTQLVFFDMQEEQQRAWEEQAREQEAKRIATETKTSAAVAKVDQKHQVDETWKLSNGSGITQRLSMKRESLTILTE